MIFFCFSAFFALCLICLVLFFWHMTAHKTHIQIAWLGQPLCHPRPRLRTSSICHCQVMPKDDDNGSDSVCAVLGLGHFFVFSDWRPDWVLCVLLAISINLTQFDVTVNAAIWQHWLRDVCAAESSVWDWRFCYIYSQVVPSNLISNSIQISTEKGN